MVLTQKEIEEILKNPDKECLTDEELDNLLITIAEKDNKVLLIILHLITNKGIINYEYKNRSKTNIEKLE